MDTQAGVDCFGEVGSAIGCLLSTGLDDAGLMVAGAVVLEEYVAGDAVEPWQVVAGMCFPMSPRTGEHFRCEVFAGCGVAASTNVRQDLGIVSYVTGAEVLARVVRVASCHWVLSIG